MAFGSSAKTKNTDTTMNENRENPFLDVRNGIRIFQLPAGTEEVRVKRHWVALNDNGTCEPKFGFNPNDKRKAFPVVVAYFSAASEKWIGATSSNWRNNPIDNWVKTLEAEEQKGKYAQEIFHLSVVDLTQVMVGSDGTICYPNETMKYLNAPKDAKKIVSGKPRILTGSAGDPSGKSLYANLIRLANTALNDEGEPLSIYDYQIRLVITGSGKETNRNFNMGKVAPLAEEYASLPVYDVMSMCRPWPNEAIQALLDGETTYADALKEYSIVTYPALVPNVQSVDESEELF
jgi:hypothetical protein